MTERERSHPRLRELRRARRLSQDELGFQSGVSQARLSRAERGYINLGEEECQRIAAVLGVEPEAVTARDAGQVDNEPSEMDLGAFDEAPMWTRGDNINKHADKNPGELAEMIVNHIEQEVMKDEFDEKAREDLLSDISIFLGVWGRKRKEEAEPVFRKKLRDARLKLEGLLDQVDATLRVVNELWPDEAAPEEADGSDEHVPG